MLLRFDPFREFDRLAQELWSASPANGAPARIPMDAVRRDDHLEIHFELPGVDPASIDVEVDKDLLTVSAERTDERERRDGDQLLVRERRYGRFARQVSLGDNLDVDRLTADYRDGVLTVTVPVAEQARPRKIEVGTGVRAPAIEAEASEAPAEADEQARDAA